MTDLRKAAEQALEALEHFNQGNSLAVVQGEFDDEIEKLRHALHSTKFLPEEMDAYERGFIEGRQDQMRSTVERAVNAMTKREWVGLTNEQIYEHRWWHHDTSFAVNKELKEKNSAPYTKNDTSDRVLHKEWVALTDEDIDVYALDIGVTANKAPSWLVKYARDIEAALKEKNRG